MVILKDAASTALYGSRGANGVVLITTKKGEKGKEGKGKKKGENRSKELMELAKNQEQIRKQLMELRDEMGKNGEKGKFDNIITKL